MRQSSLKTCFIIIILYAFCGAMRKLFHWHCVDFATYFAAVIIAPRILRKKRKLPTSERCTPSSRNTERWLFQSRLCCQNTIVSWPVHAASKNSFIHATLTVPFSNEKCRHESRRIIWDMTTRFTPLATNVFAKQKTAMPTACGGGPY